MFTAAGRGAAPLSTRTGQWLIGAEVALALVLLVGAGLIVRSFTKLVSVDLGFDTANVLTLEVEPIEQAAVIRRTYYPALADALRALPEVVAVAAIDQIALTGGGTYYYPTADNGQRIGGPQRTVLPGYLETMAVRPVAGRLLEPADVATGESVVVNTTLANQYFGGDAIGHTMRSGTSQRLQRIVGVVRDIRHGGPQRRVQPEMYVLPDPRDDRIGSGRMAMVMRLREGATLSLERLKSTAESVGPRVLVGSARPAADLISEQVAAPRHRMLLLTLLGVFGLLLTLVGIFSVTAYAVARRTREIGVRVAVGARPAQVVAVMIREVAWPVALGLAAGLAGTYYATRIITSFLFETAPHDPATLVIVVSLLGASAGVAAWLPARRAASIDPVVALRTD